MKKLALGVALVASSLAACDNDGPRRTPVNEAPSLSNIADQSAMANQPTPAIGFTVQDEDPTGVTIALSSDQQALIPDTGLTVVGAGGSRSIVAEPVADSTGSANITVTATDVGGRTAATSFLLSIVPQQQSMQNFTRDAFNADPDGDPALINAIEFQQDADDDEFADLLTN